LPLTAVFDGLPDPRRDTQNKLHRLTDILVITTCAVIGGAETWEVIAESSRRSCRTGTSGYVMASGRSMTPPPARPCGWSRRGTGTWRPLSLWLNWRWWDEWREREQAMSEPISPAALQPLSFLAGATDEEVRRLAEAANWAHHPAGSVLFREGEKVTGLWIVVTGNVAIEIVGPERRSHRIHTVGDGELLGWSPVLGTGPMTATARALTDVHSVAIDAGAILAMCEADPRFGYLFMRRVAAAIAARLHSTRLQLLEVYRSELPLLHL
jgi:hypothetical protein